jgi:S-adenosylmethionine hydrolase
MARPILALLTDFGLHDHYVGAMKAVILGICPDATIFDITHDIAPQDILAGALELQAVVPVLPAAAIVVAVVDPGVGSSRRGVAVECGGVRFVGPDNGLIELATRNRAEVTAVELTNQAFARDTISRTFEGRDRFAPAAAWLAAGVPLADLGPAIDRLVAIDVPVAVAGATTIDGVVLRVDRFGNLITNITRHALERLGGEPSVRIGSAEIDRVSATYAEAAPGALCALVGSAERLEIAVNGGSAADVLVLGRGAAVQVRVRSAA